MGKKWKTTIWNSLTANEPPHQHAINELSLATVISNIYTNAINIIIENQSNIKAFTLMNPEWTEFFAPTLDQENIEQQRINFMNFMFGHRHNVGGKNSLTSVTTEIIFGEELDRIETLYSSIFCVIHNLPKNQEIEQLDFLCNPCCNDFLSEMVSAEMEKAFGEAKKEIHNDKAS
jgi:hypothetical protein